VIEVVGYFGSAGAAVMWLPQVVRVIRHRNDLDALAGISAVAYLTAVLFNALLLSYGWLSHAAPVVLAGSVNLGCASVIVLLLGRARSAAR
jgi:uncharacterized protein with PQ loop repeat